jgi:hypothetical protein
MRTAVYVGRFVACSVTLMITAGATWINPPAQPGAPPAERSQAPIALHPESGIVPNTGTDAVADSGITVTRWEFSPAVPGRPVYLSMTLGGTQTAIDRMQSGPLAIQVHWVRENAGAEPGAPNLVTDLTIGRPDLTGALGGEVRRKGFFEWHSWARKDTLGPGTWTVSLTYRDGQPLRCAPDAQPCRFTLNVG